MSLRVLLLGMLGGCQLLFPLGEPAPSDGPPPVDQATGSLVCPAPGTAPQYGSNLFTRATNCFNYTEALDGRGVAACGEVFAESAQDDPSFTPIPTFTSDTQTQYEQPRLAPEGEQLFMIVRDVTNTTTLQTSVKSGSEWGAPEVITSDEPGLLIVVLGIGTPTSGAIRRMMINTSDGIHEVQLDGLAVTTVETYPAKDFGFTFVQTPNLTSDGLRAVAQGLFESGEQQVMYMERTSIEVPFETAVVLDGAPLSSDMFMTSNCARLYAGSAGKVLYAPQL